MECEFCNNLAKSIKSLRAHQAVCSRNPNRKNPADWATGNRKGIPSWNSGLNGDVRCKLSDETKNKLSKATSERSVEFNKSVGRKVSETIRKKVAAGTWHTSLAKKMHLVYKGITLHGTWELKYAQYLDSKGIAWIRNKDSFHYEFGGKSRRYTPDFYLPETDEYIEIKGYKTQKDDAKWTQFPLHRKLIVLMREDLISLGICIN